MKPLEHDLGSENEVSATDQWHISEHIHPLLHDGGAVLFNSQTGKPRAINRSLALTMLEVSGLVDNMQLEWPEMREPIVTPTLVYQVAKAGLISPGPALDDAPRAYPYARLPDDVDLLEAGAIPALRARPKPLSVPEYLEDEAASCLRQAIELIKYVQQESSLAIATNALEKARGFGTTTPDLEKARMLARVIFQVGYDHLGKVACLERSIGTALLGATQGYFIEVHFGAKVDPINFHTWPAVLGDPVQLEDEERARGYYHSMHFI